MTIPTPEIPSTPPSAVTIATVRTLSPIIVTILTGLLVKANVHLDNTTLTTTVAWAIGGVLGTVWKLGVGWLEAHKASWWGHLFFISAAPSYLTKLGAPASTVTVVVPGPVPAVPAPPTPTVGTTP